jgi:hypothetical protein
LYPENTKEKNTASKQLKHKAAAQGRAFGGGKRFIKEKMCFVDAFVYGYATENSAFVACKRLPLRIALSFIQ